MHMRLWKIFTLIVSAWSRVRPHWHGRVVLNIDYLAELKVVRSWMKLWSKKSIDFRFVLHKFRPNKQDFKELNKWISEIPTLLKFRCYEKATRFEKISHLSWQNNCFQFSSFKKSGRFFFQIFVAFSEYIK